jgi:hypothetical protein
VKGFKGVDADDVDYNHHDSLPLITQNNTHTLPLQNFVLFAERAGLSDEMAAYGCTSAF